MMKRTHALVAALSILLAACGGGDPEPSALGELTVVTAGGRADVAAQSLAVDLHGPTITLAAPATVLVEIDLDWQQSLLAPSALSFSVSVRSASSAPQTTALISTALTRFASSHAVQVALPAGQTTLSGLGRVAASNAGVPVGALAYFDITAVWRVTLAQ